MTKWVQDAIPGMPDPRVEMILDDLRSALTDWRDEEETWDDIVDTAMNEAWDALLRLDHD